VQPLLRSCCAYRHHMAPARAAPAAPQVYGDLQHSAVQRSAAQGSAGQRSAGQRKARHMQWHYKLLHPSPHNITSRRSTPPTLILPRYQQVVHECSLCSHPINDGSERLWTGRHEAPHGEYRFECGTCQGFNLCQSCWDKHQAQLQQGGPGLHDAAHVFEHHGPQMSRHGASASRQATANNPWGNAFTGGSVGRARERLKERTGM
jgi:hypothetical protein